MYVKILSDNWDDLGKVYEVVVSHRRDSSTAVQLLLLDEDGSEIDRTVNVNDVRFMDDKPE